MLGPYIDSNFFFMFFANFFSHFNDRETKVCLFLLPARNCYKQPGIASSGQEQPPSRGALRSKSLLARFCPDFKVKKCLLRAIARMCMFMWMCLRVCACVCADARKLMDMVKACSDAETETIECTRH